MNFFRYLNLFILLFFMLNNGYSQEISNENQEKKEKNTSFYKDPTVNRIENTSYSYFFVKSIVVLLFFAIAGFFVSKYLKKRTGRLNVVGGPIEILYSYPLGIGKSLDVLKVVNDVLLVSNVQEKIEFIYKIEEKEAIDIFKLERDKKDLTKSSFFSDIFSRYSKLKVGEAIDVTRNLKKKIESNKKERKE